MAGKGTTSDDRVWRELRQRVRGIARAHVKVGIVGEAADAEVGEGGGVTMGMLGTWFELGTRFMDRRSWLGRTFEMKLDELRGMQLKIAKALILERIDLRQALGMLGAWAAGAVKATITQGKIVPPNRPSTIARKGSSKPLVDTGQFVNSISWITSEDG